jgi:N-acylneuraminate cytidylyltransferase
MSTKSKKYLALIPARSGSQRIKNKNIKNFRGHPIMAWSIDTALKSDLFDTVMVSTDCGKIAKIATDYGATVPFFRSSQNSDDHATIAQVIEETYSELTKIGKSFDGICCIYATSPFTTVSQLRQGLELMETSGFDSIFPITHFEYPIQRALFKDDNDTVSFVDPQYTQTRSQDLPERFHDAGMWIWINVSKFNGQNSLFTENTGSLFVEPSQCHDIDTEVDWQIAVIKHQLNFADSDIKINVL